MDDQQYEINIKRFIQSTEYQLKKLQECVNKSNEFSRYQDFKNVRQAQMNASQIVRRIKSDMKQLQSIREQVVSQLENKASSPIVVRIDEQLKVIAANLKSMADQIETMEAPYHQYELKDQDLIFEANGSPPFMYTYELKKNEVLENDKELCEAYHQLQKDCEDLKATMQIFSEEIYKQGHTIDTIESNISGAQLNVQAAAGSLRQAVKYKALSTAAGGALLGTAIGGPVGMLMGAKIGAVIGLTSGVAAYFAAKRLTKPSEPEPTPTTTTPPTPALTASS